jgi:hypothetical protein
MCLLPQLQELIPVHVRELDARRDSTTYNAVFTYSQELYTRVSMGLAIMTAIKAARTYIQRSQRSQH